MFPTSISCVVHSWMCVNVCECSQSWSSQTGMRQKYFASHSIHFYTDFQAGRVGLSACCLYVFFMHMGTWYYACIMSENTILVYRPAGNMDNKIVSQIEHQNYLHVKLCDF